MLSHQQSAVFPGGQENTTANVRNKENSSLGTSNLAGKENSALSFKTPARRQQRQALGNITNKTPKTGPGPSSTRRAFGEVKTPKTGGSLSLSVQRSGKKAHASAGAQSAGRPLQARPSWSQKKEGLGASLRQEKVGGTHLLAREVARRADLFAEDGVEFWMGDSFEEQERKRMAAESQDVRQSVEEMRQFMKGSQGQRTHQGPRTLPVPQKEECGDAPPGKHQPQSSPEREEGKHA